MGFKTITKVSVLFITCVSLSACFGSSGSSTSTGAGSGGGTGSGGGSGGSGNTFTTGFDTVNLLPPTQTALSGSADYTGEVSIRTNANAANTDEVLVGDLDMNVNFNPNTARPITATAGNFAGEIDGTQVTATGTLSTANAPSGVNAVSTTAVNIPGQGAATFTGLSVELRGTLAEPTDNLTGDVVMTMQGDMRGTDGAAAAGAAGVSVQPASGPAIITGGTWYMNKD